ncbi:hypothetical protein FBU59_000624 [Linderina macrospora]|uniref:Uncharacterized protein n=1 Tax=Linderina macrospora TaxID=4868 RepID=A0ACC1JGA4_9FUNG|nr:hypothetical protein FBU59_000624 [Linderina macrospora]
MLLGTEVQLCHCCADDGNSRPPIRNTTNLAGCSNCNKSLANHLVQLHKLD